MTTRFKAFLRNARKKQVTWRGSLVALFGACGLISMVVCLIELITTGTVAGQSIWSVCFSVWMAFAVGNRGGLWKEQTQVSAESRV